MKRTQIFKIGLLSSLLAFGACGEDFLIEEPVLEQTNELTLSNYVGLNDATAGAYTTIYSVNWYGRYLPIFGDMRGGNAKLSPKSSGRFTNEFYWNHTQASTSPLWGSAYYAISKANNVINALPLIEDPLITQQQLDNLEAECLFIRAISHFDLVRTYAQPYSYQPESLGVPIVLLTENGSPARNTVSEVYAQVLDDLKRAELIIEPDYVREGGKDPKAFVTLQAIQALLARVYLYMEDWQNAANYATTLIESGDYNMYTAAEYTTWDADGVWGAINFSTSGEVIFGVYGSENNSSHGNWDNITYILSPEGYGDVGASDDLLDLFEAGDVRRNLYRTHPDYGDAEWPLKYPGKVGNLREDNIPVFRLSEMYLIRAEALLKGATIPGATAVKDVNMIRTNRGLVDLAIVSFVDIWTERRRELCFEGHEYFDLARTQRGLTRTDYPSGAINKDVNFPDNKWAMPIPQGEMDANPNMVQNPL